MKKERIDPDRHHQVRQRRIEVVFARHDGGGDHRRHRRFEQGDLNGLSVRAEQLHVEQVDRQRCKNELECQADGEVALMFGDMPQAQLHADRQQRQRRERVAQAFQQHREPFGILDRDQQQGNRRAR